MLNNTIKVNYEVAKTPHKAKQLLDKISQYPKIAWDLETSVKYTDEEIEHWNNLIESGSLTKLERIYYQSKINATALMHPSHCMVTHCSIAISEDTGYVFVFNNMSVQNLVFNYLMNSKQTQILHNASYDLKFTAYFTKRYPAIIEDTEVLAKTIINHVEIQKARTRLKDLAGHMYGDWGISTDYFTYKEMNNPKVIKYAATDACATMWLWNYLQEQCDILDRGIYNEACNQ
jgi:hypothetical protein